VRTRFFAELLEAAKQNPDLVLITGDLGFGVIEPFVEAVPTQFINAGVAEQNMTGLAAGIALSGGKVFTYSIANFPTLRCLEQIRNDVVYHGSDVVVVAVGGGLAYGALGMSHHATEDLAIMRAIPGLAVAAPGDPAETSAVLADLIEFGGPAYLRLGKAGERTVHKASLRVRRGEAVHVRTGSDVCLVSTGAMLPVADDAAVLLEEQGLSVSLMSFPWIAPLDRTALLEAAAVHQLVVTVEEHTITGGLGGAVAEIMAEARRVAVLLRVGLPHRFSSVVGDQEYLRSLHGLTAGAIATRTLKAMEENRALARQVY
jgi:transketolase